MADATHDPPAHAFLDEFRRHVRTPLRTAASTVEREREEVEVERAAFSAFADRLDGIAVDRPRPRSAAAPPLTTRESATDSMDAVRRAYRETVLDVPHYQTVYDEPLLDNVGAELGPDLADWLDPENEVPSTESARDAIRRATERAIRSRRTFKKVLAAEAESIDRADRKLSELVGELDSTVVPRWYRDRFAERLDAVAAERQETIRSRPSVSVTQGFVLCEYLYADEPWSYPVLTAITRLREGVELS